MKFYPSSTTTENNNTQQDTQNLIEKAELCIISIPNIGNVMIHTTNQNTQQQQNTTGNLHTALELYALQFNNNTKEQEEKKAPILLIHCRSIIIYPSLFVKDLEEWLNNKSLLKHLNSLIILSSTSSSYMDDRFIQQMIREQEEILNLNNNSDQHNDNHDNQQQTIYSSGVIGGVLACKIKIKDEQEFSKTKYLKNLIEIDEEKYPMFISGINRKKRDNKLNKALVVMICSEGENTIHGVVMAQTIVKQVLEPYVVIGNSSGTDSGIGSGISSVELNVKWQTPYSWRYFYGPPVVENNLYN
ncbi:hypothetical protein ABK040_012628 [Willaertia magna]